MSFIEQSEQNVERLMKEVSGGGVAGFVGKAGRDIDALFAGPFHPDSGHGSENEKLLQKQLDDRKEMRSNMEQEAAEDGVELIGKPSPVGGYFGDIGETEGIELAYEELLDMDEIHKEFNDDMTPLQDLEWKSTGWDYDYDEPGEAYKIRDIKYDDNSGLYKSVVSDIKYDDNSNLYADDTYINKSEINWKYIK